MTWKVSELKGDDVLARDGSVGALDDVYFDDQDWVVRYMVVDTGRWVPGRRMLIEPQAVESGISDPGKLRLDATRAELKNAPDAATAPPVYEQRRLEQAKRFGPPYYWTSLEAWGAAAATGEARNEADPHLRSSTEVIGYDVEARDGAAGSVEDLVIDAETWRIRDVVVDTARWRPGGAVRVHPRYVSAIDAAARRIHVMLTREELKLSAQPMPRR